MGVKMNFRIITKNHEADSEKRFLTKSISKSYGHARSRPPALKLIGKIKIILPNLEHNF